MKINSVGELKSFLFKKWDTKIKGIHCPNDWTFNDFWSFLIFSATEDAKVIRKTREDEQNRFHKVVHTLAPTVDKFADAFWKVAPLIAKSANKIIQKKKAEAKEREEAFSTINLLSKAYDLDSQYMNILLTIALLIMI